MVSRVLRRKLRRDIWRQRGQFAAVAVVVALGVAVFVAASDAYRNLGASFARAYTTQRLPDVVLTGPAADALAAQVAGLPGRPLVAARTQADIGARIAGHSLLTRVVAIPERAQPPVASLVVRSGRLPGVGEVLVEQHLADRFGLRQGDRIELYGPNGWSAVQVAGSGLSTEYFWPARSRQETFTSPELFGVVFAPPPVTSAITPNAERQLALYAQDRSQSPALIAAATGLARTNDLVVTTRSEQPSYVALDQDVKTFGTFAKLLPVLFLAAAVLGAFILLSRLVFAQRAVIGTLTANGISPRTLRHHYLSFGLVAGAAGALPGTIGGWALGGWLTTQYTSALGLPLHVTALHPATLAAGAAVGMAAAALAAWGPARAAARTAPAEAMRTAPAGAGRRSVLERILPGIRRLPTRWRMVLRGLTRNRRRAGFTIAGVAISLTLVLVFAGLRDTITTVLDRQFGTIDRADGQLYATSGAATTLLAAARADSSVARAEPFSRLDATLSVGSRRYNTLLVALPPSTTLHQFIAPGGRHLSLPASGGVLLAQGLRNTLAIRTGDSVTITLAADGTRLTEPVAGFVDEPMTAVAYTSIDHLDSALGHPTAVGALIQLSPGADRRAAAGRLGALAGAAAYLDNAAVEATMRDAFAIMNVLVAIMLAFAVIMAAALLFNAMSANLAERTVELGTLTAAGLSRRILARLVAAENLLLTVLGLPLGLAAGTLLARWFMSTYQTEGYRWTLRMQPATFLIVTAAVLAASVLSQLLVLRGVRRIDVAHVVRERSL
jgi:putative ABC transport system permease protein